MFKPAIAIAMMSAALQVYAAQPMSPAKQELVQKVLQLWQIDTVGQVMLQEPVTEALGQARVVLHGRVPPERQEAAMRDITTDAKKFIDDTSPLVRSTTQKLVPTTVAPLLADRFSEEELRQIIAILESPVKQKFEAMVPEMQKALGEKLAADTRPVIDPKLQDLRQRIGTRLRTAVIP